jgi:cobalamin biosynthesis protein CobT
MNATRLRRDKFFYIMQDFRSVVNCSAFHYRGIWRKRQDPSIAIAILLYDQSDTDKAVAFIHREFEEIDNIQLIITHREREFMDHCNSASARLFMEHCRSAAAAIGNSDHDEADDNDNVDDDNAVEEQEDAGDGDDVADEDSDNVAEDDQDEDDDDGTSITKARFVKNEDHGTAINYALAVLGLVTPSLLRPVAYRNMAAMHLEQYNQVQLPDLNDVQQLLLQRDRKRQ